MPKRRRPAENRLQQRTEPVPARAPSARPRSWFRDADGGFHMDLDPVRFPAILAAGVGVLWVDIDVASPDQHRLLHDVFGFHPLSIEDTTSTEGRVKFEEYAGYALAVVRGMRFVTETEELYDIETFNLWTFLGNNFVVTVHGAHAPGLELAVQHVVRTPEVLARGPARLMHLILDATVDAYFPVMDQLDEFVDGLEARVFVSFDQDAIRDIFAVKRLVLQLKRHLAPMREVFNILQSRPCVHIAPDAQIYFRDVYDHVIRLNESLDTYRDLLSSTLDSYLTQVSNRMGQVTKGLTVVATMSVPFVVVSGMWGMNFDEVPFSHMANGFWVLLGVQLALGAGLLWLLRRNGWL